MKKLLSVFCVMFLMAAGCSAMNNQPIDWNGMSASVTNYSELTARMAFQTDKVKPYQQEICNAVNEIVPFLNNYSDPNATFDSLEHAVLAVINNSTTIKNKAIISLVVQDVMQVISAYVKDAYSSLIQQSVPKTVLTLSKAVATGLHNACQPTTQTFSVMKVNHHK